MQMFLQKGEYSGLNFFSNQTFDKFNKTYFKEEGNRRAVGFDKPKPKGGGMTFEVYQKIVLVIQVYWYFYMG